MKITDPTHHLEFARFGGADSVSLPRDFYLRDAAAVARELLGAILVKRSSDGTAAGVIVETEAYAGHGDAACHSFKHHAPPPGHRTRVMFGDGGYAYVYFIYGMHNCFNVTVNVTGKPEAVLIRALEPIDGIELMCARRNTQDIGNLCRGPGKLCQALGITRSDYGRDLCGDELFIAAGKPVPDEAALTSPRINIDYAGEASAYPYRFVIKGSKFLSTRRFLPR
ncbi:MAG: DNA-3-methyladenine glycosylase [Synergistaceae bacterium]|jgi:DNA-3-methyladenine glycosylase|nr:DNA-3-methyladenine glycosylase [Synergistaceae bacterium]